MYKIFKWWLLFQASFFCRFCYLQFLRNWKVWMQWKIVKKVLHLMITILLFSPTENLWYYSFHLFCFFEGGISSRLYKMENWNSYFSMILFFSNNLQNQKHFQFQVLHLIGLFTRIYQQKLKITVIYQALEEYLTLCLSNFRLPQKLHTQYTSMQTPLLA